MSGTVINPLPTRSEQSAEESVAGASKIIQERMEAFNRGDLEGLQNKHRDDISEGNKKADYPTMIVDLPSKGKLYPPENPLSLGFVEMKFMTAKEEDILTTESYIKKGVVLDKLFQSLIVTKINYNTMLIGDRDAIMMAARIYGYGELYETKIQTPSGNTQTVPINLNDIPHKVVDESLYSSGENKFFFKTTAGTNIEFHLLTNGDQNDIQEILRKAKKPDARDTQLTTRLYQMIDAIDGNTDRKFIKLFVENEFRALDSRKFREYVNEIQPGIDMDIDVVDEETGDSFRTSVAIGLDFFWTNV